MKVKTSITLSQDVLEDIDRLAASRSRSEVIEQALRVWLESRAQRERDSRELRIINRHARRLNREALDILDYQEPES